MQIRPVEMRDAESLRDSCVPGMSLEWVRDLLDSDWLKDDRGALIVAVDDAETVLGSVNVRRNEHRLRRHRASLGGFVVIESARGTGLARKLTDACADWARERGCTILELEVRGGTHAENAYRGLGFIEFGRLPGGLIEDAGTFDQGEMYLPL
jgi:GNAT superfamily N-acetyltransferase